MVLQKAGAYAGGVHRVHVHPAPDTKVRSVRSDTARYEQSKRDEMKERKWRTAVQVGTTNYVEDIFRLFHVFLSILLVLKIK